MSLGDPFFPFLDYLREPRKPRVVKPPTPRPSKGGGKKKGAAKKTRILFVDDELERAGPFRDDLAEHLPGGAEVVLVGNPQHGLRRAKTSRWDVVVLGIMMAHRQSPNFSRAATQGGTIAGIILYRLLRQAKPQQPVMFLTNMRAENVHRNCPELRGDRRARLCLKVETLPQKLTTRVAAML